MHVPADFFFPPGATAPTATRVGRALYTAPAAADLLPYAAALDTYVRDTATAADATLRTPPARHGGSLPVLRWLPTFRYPRWDGDIVVVGECTRAAEIDLMARIVEALLHSGRSVLYLCVNRGEHAAMQRHRRQARWSGACTIARLSTAEHNRWQFWLHADAPAQLRRDWQQLAPLLAASAAHLRRDAGAALREIALAKVQWGILKQRLRFHTAITRTKHLPLSAALLSDCLTNQRLSISLQHSIVTCPASFSPLLAKRYLCFGDRSRRVLGDLEQELAEATGHTRPPCHLVSAGRFLDPLQSVSARRDNGSVLVVDQTSTWAPRFFGGSEQFAALHRVVPLLAQSPAVRRIVVRLHPTSEGHCAWDEIAARAPERVVVTRGDRPLAADVAGISAVVGLFSSVLPAAAAAGLPTFFLWQPGWFFTPDLAPFAATQLVSPPELVGRIERLLNDANYFAIESDAARQAAAAYYHASVFCGLDAGLVEEILAPLPGLNGCA